MAVKVLSHEGSQSARVNALHESVVSQHVSHPNVVRLCLFLKLPFVHTPCCTASCNAFEGGRPQTSCQSAFCN